MIPWGVIGKLILLAILTSGMNECTNHNKRVGNSPRYWYKTPDPSRDTVYNYLDSVYKAELKQRATFKPYP